MRPSTACTICRSRKRKCIISGDGEHCNVCRALGVPCSRADGSALSSARLSPAADGLAIYSTPDESDMAVAADLMPDASICNELVDLYFDLMHDKQHALFHRPSFTADQRQGKAPLMLVTGMMALGARFSSNPYFKDTDPWTRGRIWADYSKTLFDNRAVAVSLQAIQACIVLSTLSFVENDMAMESLYGALAIRMVQLLDLPNRLSSDVVERETSIRVWWNVWMMDKWSSAGARLPVQLIAGPAYPKPMEEISFEMLVPGTPSLESESIEDSIRLRESGLWAQMIPLTEIICQTNDLHEMIVLHRVTPLEVYEKVQLIANKLDSWQFRLPKHLHDTPENLDRFNSLGHGRTLMALHLGYHHQCQLLYYHFLHHDPRTSPNRALAYIYANRCKEHAANISKVLWTANSTPGCECLWVITGHLLVVSSSIHLHTLLFDVNELHIANAKTMLKQNFELMIKLRKYWPSLDLSMSRLRAFHRACQMSMNTSFAMDEWMLHFLQRYTRSVGDKYELSLLGDASGAADWPSPVQNFNSHQQLWYGDHEVGTGSEILDSFL